MGKKVIGMGRKVAGPTGSWQRRWVTSVSLVVIVAATLIFVRTVLAVHDAGGIEMDGNAETGVVAPFDVQTSHDWDQVYQDSLTDPHGVTSGAVAISFTAEPNPASTIFTGGGSKDPQFIGSWLWKNDQNNPPDKDNLVNSFAARYEFTPTEPPGPGEDPPANPCYNGTGGPGQPTFDPTIPCVILYFGSDRFDNSGDATQAFWFFQNEIGLDGPAGGGGTHFTGEHVPGDLLVISEFSNGGDKSTIIILAWDPVRQDPVTGDWIGCAATNKAPNPDNPKQTITDGDCADANLRTLESSSAANCANATAGDAFCGLVNPADGTPTQWPFTDKSGNSDHYLQGEFFEAGVNLSMLGLGGECFSSVSSESRSSTSTTAVLKDFVLGQFANCFPTMTTQASTSGPVIPGVAVYDTATIQIQGGANPADPTGTVTFYLCGPIATGSCQTGGTNIGTGALVGGVNTTDGTAVAQSPNVNTNASPLSAGRYCFRAEWPGDSNYGPISHTNDTTECFAVKDTSAVSTAQNWLPNDTATVTLGSGGTPSGTVTFTLHAGANCTGTLLATFADRPVVNGTASTNNTTTFIVTSASANKTISWLAVFTPSNTSAVNGSTASCETSTVTIDDDITQ